MNGVGLGFLKVLRSSLFSGLAEVGAFDCSHGFRDSFPIQTGSATSVAGSGAFSAAGSATSAAGSGASSVAGFGTFGLFRSGLSTFHYGFGASQPQRFNFRLLGLP